ncbi:DUF397 domain-containing protein [Micromonospora sp. ATA32]|nr:DUF397 domain-containing protein [Micromonospora sp. ATA32]
MTVQRPLNKWFKSTQSGPNCDNSVLVRFRGGGVVETKDSKDPNGPAHVWDAEEWDAFVAGARAGEFDMPEHAR